MEDLGDEERILIISILGRKLRGKALFFLSHLQSCIGLKEIVSCIFCKRNGVSGKLWRMSSKRIRFQN